MPHRTIPQLPGFELIERIGRGAGATIELGVETATHRRFAIKHVIRHGPRDDRFVVQAENEFEVAHRFDHPFLRRYYDLLRIRRWLKTQQLFLIMEYVDGVTLEERWHSVLRTTGRTMSQRALIPVFIQVAEGLHAMHLGGYVHADLKPKNILLSKDDGLKLIDFGQSCPQGHRKERVQGTPAFMAPEQVLREPIDQRTDVFSLGASMYWVTTGKEFKTMMPTAAAGTRKVELEARRGNEPPHELNPRVPVPVSRLIMDCCNTRPSARPHDMREIISRLEVVLHLLEKDDHAPGAPRRPGRRPPTGTTRRRESPG